MIADEASAAFKGHMIRPMLLHFDGETNAAKPKLIFELQQPIERAGIVQQHNQVDVLCPLAITLNARD